MKKTLMLALISICFAVTSVFSANFQDYLNKVENLKKKGISYTVSSVTNNGTVKAKVYMKGEKIRLDAAEGSTIINDKDMYVYSEQEKIAMKMNIDTANIKQTTFDIIQDKADELKFVEKSSKNGYSCQVFKSKDKGKNVVYYLTDDYGFPTYIKEDNSETNITDFKVGNVSDSLFVLPKDVNVMDMTNFSLQDMIEGM
ncbi:MAG: DUF4412 domain-containing protein [Endomicrobiaceae bacterium]|nr:DUF4412 domain-containing protein [Endomicrobiaceae bacterium]